ncbi:hypothetical protein SAMN05216275_14847 [Streptosporangium canum]|uniref:Uncharacterized protein n=1 Tax=Streptosporangium canum TaxID=324952 RepID=A0A1I4ECE1_9ACTN|nr:hypothetical protein SAMN05216275_14847 [Streptosporangium canum]
MADGGKTAADLGAWVCFEDECGRTLLRPPKARTWGRRGITPVVAVSGGPGGRVSIAGTVCHRLGHRSRLITALDDPIGGPMGKSPIA